MILTDTHTHLYSEAFDGDRDRMMQRALEVGVERFFVPAIDSTYHTAMFSLEESYPDRVFLMMGLHPTHVGANYMEELALVEDWLEKRKFHAVGEIGIDLYWDKSRLREQQDAFSRQIGLAKKHGLPISIHCREAFDEVFEVLEGEAGADLFGIFHCFTGSLEQAERALSLNMKLGIGGVVTFKNGMIDRFLDQIDLDHLVLETDSPYLAPVPHRGKRNESSYIIEVVQKLSSIYNRPEGEIAAITTENSRQIFGI